MPLGKSRGAVVIVSALRGKGAADLPLPPGRGSPVETSAEGRSADRRDSGDGGITKGDDGEGKSTDRAGSREVRGCSFVKGKKILVSSDITSFGASVCVSNRRVIAVKNGKLKMKKDFHYYYSRGREGFIEEVSGKTYSCLDDIMTAWGKAGFKGHEHKYEKSSDISGAHIYAYHSYGSGTETTCSFFVDKTNIKSHLK